MKLSNLHPSPKCWHDISNTNLYIQLLHSSKNVHSPNPVPEGHNETLQLTNTWVNSVIFVPFQMPHQKCPCQRAAVTQYLNYDANDPIYMHFTLCHIFLLSPLSFHNFPCHNSHVIIFHVIISMSKWVPVQIFPSSKFFKFKWVPDEKIP